jgi:hypothetical protein
MTKKIYLLLLAGLVSISFAEAQKKKKTKTKTETVTAPAPAQPVLKPYTEVATQFAGTITASDLSKHLHILASDEFEGRETGKKGQKMAAEYIARHFSEIGLASPVKTDQPYYQTFELEQSAWQEASLRVKNKDYVYLKDFYVQGDVSSNENQKLDLVFVGYGIDDKNYSDYQNLDVKGKTVVMLSGEPKNAQGNYLVTGTKEVSPWSGHWRTKIRAAAAKGAKNVVVISTDSEAQFQSTIKQLKHWLENPILNFADKKNNAPASIFVSQPVGTAFLGTDVKKLQSYVANVQKAGKPVAGSFKPTSDATFKAVKNRTVISTENVLGYLEGTDKKDEVLVISAHYDHVGMDPTLNGDQIFNGADDDGSGTSAVLEMAEAFSEAAKAGYRPRRSMLFMTVTAEEKGLLGSEYYTNNPIFPLENTVVDLNIDMIGRLDKAHENNPKYVYVIGSDKLSSELHKINEEANSKYTQLDLDYTFNDENDPNRFYYRSDHYNFAKNGIPVAFFFNGVHEDYHQPGDEVEKILFDKMENITRLVFYTAWELANREERIKVDSNKK